MSGELKRINSFAEGLWGPSEDEGANPLPEPEYLKTSLLIEFTHGDSQFALLCTACSVRTLECSKTGKSLDWIHCKAILIHQAKENSSTLSTTLLFPIDYVTRACPGPKYEIADRHPTVDIGVFPAVHDAPVDRIPAFEVHRALTRCRGLDVPEPSSGRMYNDFLGAISRKFEAAISEISAVYNFDLGDEFEIALCKTLRSVLPQKFGICRGFVVSARGDVEGDDIIIFDRMRFPTIRSLKDDEYILKEQVPIDAVYAYIEAKHTLEIHGDGGSSLSKAVRQVSRVKLLCKQRRDVEIGEFPPFAVFENVKPNPGWPHSRNPVYGAIIARQVRAKPGTKVIDDAVVIQQEICKASVKCEIAPDLIVAGKNNLTIPAITLPDGNGSQSPSPFHIDKQSHACPVSVDGIAFGAGLGFLLWALDWIQLGDMPWPVILRNGMPPPPPTGNQ